jgi:hypothetical protein
LCRAFYRAVRTRAVVGATNGWPAQFRAERLPTNRYKLSLWFVRPRFGRRRLLRDCAAFVARIRTCGTGSVGIDLGLNSLVATSDGDTIPTPRFARRGRSAQRRRQRALARGRIGSKPKPVSRRPRRRLPGKGAITCMSSRAPWSRDTRASRSKTSTWPDSSAGCSPGPSTMPRGRAARPVRQVQGCKRQCRGEAGRFTRHFAGLPGLRHDQGQDAPRTPALLLMRLHARPRCRGRPDRAPAGVQSRPEYRPSGPKPAGCRIAVLRSRLLQRAE